MSDECEEIKKLGEFFVRKLRGNTTVDILLHFFPDFKEIEDHRLFSFDRRTVDSLFSDTVEESDYSINIGICPAFGYLTAVIYFGHEYVSHDSAIGKKTEHGMKADVTSCNPGFY